MFLDISIDRYRLQMEMHVISFSLSLSQNSTSPFDAAKKSRPETVTEIPGRNYFSGTVGRAAG